ncbi:LysR family transcriptional regulator [Pseudomonas caspiana]|uniref:LysR family transcriptional regulator n=1 Tax=Pseudomonas caspiana TaxID=1451454 RepID=A0A1Y3P0M1_9PSED|nr:LysR family transcriptional regulator [Pseudomonas caspiana]OUM73359.1 LysR family transcriptional regulator [Pseudomonas caspiana]
MDKLLALKMFVESVDAKGFSAAARKLDLATSSVTRMIGALEAELGAVLLNRSTRQVTLTEAGVSYYQKARKILEDVAEADAQIMDRGDEPVGQLRVCVPVEFGRRLIAPHLGRFLARHPHLELDIDLSDELDDLLGGRYDVAIRLGAAAPNDELVCRKVGEFSRWVVASPGYLAEHGRPVEPDDLLQHCCLRFSYAGHRQVWTFVRAGDAQQVEVKGRLKSSNADVLRKAALAGAGVALLADWLVSTDVAKGTLARVLSDYEINPYRASSAINALYLPNHRGSRRVNTFIDFLTELLGTCNEYSKK